MRTDSCSNRAGTKTHTCHFLMLFQRYLNSSKPSFPVLSLWVTVKNITVESLGNFGFLKNLSLLNLSLLRLKEQRMQEVTLLLSNTLQNATASAPPRFCPLRTQHWIWTQVDNDQSHCSDSSIVPHENHTFNPLYVTLLVTRTVTFDANVLTSPLQNKRERLCSIRISPEGSHP